MYRNRKQLTFRQNAASVATVFSTVQGGVLSHVVNGMSHPPKNSVVMRADAVTMFERSEEHTSELQSHSDLVCRLLLEKKNTRHVNAVRGLIARSLAMRCTVPAPAVIS